MNKFTTNFDSGCDVAVLLRGASAVGSAMPETALHEMKSAAQISVA